MMPKKMQYERVEINVPIVGIIENVERDENHKATYEGKEKISDCIRLVFRLDGCVYLHKSNWMSFSYGSKSSLYTKYLVNLVENPMPDMEFDILALKGKAVETVWSETVYNDKTFQHVHSISAIGPKIKQDAAIPEIDVNGPPAEPQEEEPPLEEPNF